VVFGGESQVWAVDRSVRLTESVECLRARDLVDQVKVDEQQVWFTVDPPNHVSVPDLLGKSARAAIDWF
jgi:hypothetical protein